MMRLCSLSTMAPLVGGEPAAPVNVGKLRSEADAALISDVEKSIKLMDQVQIKR
jgi:hypothetical protein